MGEYTYASLCECPNSCQVNASYVYGLSLIPMHMRRALGALTPWETFARATEVKLDGFAEGGMVKEGLDEETVPANVARG